MPRRTDPFYGGKYKLDDVETLVFKNPQRTTQKQLDKWVESENEWITLEYVELEGDMAEFEVFDSKAAEITLEEIYEFQESLKKKFNLQLQYIKLSDGRQMPAKAIYHLYKTMDKVDESVRRLLKQIVTEIKTTLKESIQDKDDAQDAAFEYFDNGGKVVGVKDSWKVEKLEMLDANRETWKNDGSWLDGEVEAELTLKDSRGIKQVGGILFQMQNGKITSAMFSLKKK